MGIVDIDERIIGQMRNELQPSRYVGDAGQRVNRPRFIAVGADHKTKRTECVHGLKLPGERQQDVTFLPEHLNGEALAGNLRLKRNKPKLLALAAIGNDVETPFFRSAEKGGTNLGIRIEDSGSFRIQNPGDETELGR